MQPRRISGEPSNPVEDSKNENDGDPVTGERAHSMALGPCFSRSIRDRPARRINNPARSRMLILLPPPEPPLNMFTKLCHLVQQ